MARGTLPWLKGSSGQTTPKTKSVRTPRSEREVKEVSGSTASATRKRRRSTPPLSESDSDIDALKVATPRRKGSYEPTNRNPSSSPPPPLPTAPEPMRAGLTADDAWIMVEDEMLATANFFTRQLHHEEYQRLKKLVKEPEVVEPFLGGAISATSLGRSQPKRKRFGVDEAVDDFGGDGDAADPWKADSQLASLMESPRKNAKVLTSAALAERAHKNTSRAQQSPSRRSESPEASPSRVTGISRHVDRTRSPVKLSSIASKTIERPALSDDSHDDDDLNMSTVRGKTSKGSHPEFPSTNKARDMTTTRPAPDNVFKRFASKPASTDSAQHVLGARPTSTQLPSTSHAKSRQPTTSVTVNAQSNTHEYDDTALKHSAEAEAILARRKARTAKKLLQEQKQQAEFTSTEKDRNSPRKRRRSSPSEIPTFLF